MNKNYQNTSLVLGIFSIFIILIPCMHFITYITAILAVIFGFMSLKDEQQNTSTKSLWGIILGMIAIVIESAFIVYIWGKTFS